MFKMEKAIEYEKYFSIEQTYSHKLISGKRKIMISAPHSVSQTRNGVIKYAEPQTGVLAKLLHDELDCPVIFKTKNCGDDANFDEHSHYKDDLVNYIINNGIKFLIDLHLLAPNRIEQIDIGTGKLKNISDFNLINIFLRSFTQRKIGIVQIDTPFGATYPFTISSYIAQICGIPCVQLEINSALVWLGHEGCVIDEIFNSLKEIVISVEKIL